MKLRQNLFKKENVLNWQMLFVVRYKICILVKFFFLCTLPTPRILYLFSVLKNFTVISFREFLWVYFISLILSIELILIMSVLIVFKKNNNKANKTAHHSEILLAQSVHLNTLTWRVKKNFLSYLQLNDNYVLWHSRISIYSKRH